MYDTALLQIGRQATVIAMWEPTSWMPAATLMNSPQNNASRYQLQETCAGCHLSPPLPVEFDFNGLTLAKCAFEGEWVGRALHADKIEWMHCMTLGLD